MKNPYEYAIIDVETTGLGGTSGNRITEIAVAIYDGNCVTDYYHSLVNPESAISKFVTGLTGIDESMVIGAPTFSQIAPKLLELTQSRIFVAHNVNFDYNVLRKEFERVDVNFKRKRLCTVRLARQLFPGYRSYSLGNLCNQLGIAINSRHRAKGDTDATVLLMEKLIAKDTTGIIAKHLHAHSGEVALPPLLSKEVYETLPSRNGVYYFKNSKGVIIYVGKAKNIKKRVLSHFYDKSPQEIALCSETAHIDHEVTGSELLALLAESAAIKKYYPKYNRAQKKVNARYAIVSYTNRVGIVQLGYCTIKTAFNPIVICYSSTEAIAFLEMLCEQFELCPKYTQLQQNVKTCSHFKISNCRGICHQKESVSDYNKRVENAISFMKETRDNLLIREKGRTNEETAFVWIKNGIYRGYGFIENNAVIQTSQNLEPWLQPQTDNSDVRRIIAQYVHKFPQNVVLNNTPAT
ncbi:exonuclease domain-containing protein [Ascidiimonas sp. W6]|uniref:exonuclease domain-containing protein n=1 Tax=Ascidiimonas meishanensis TaxID=3128903 RepID=UPI0030EC3531